jgi:SAM-dependent methyltransferase
VPASFDRPAAPESGPSGWVVRALPLVRPGGAVLDVAAGHGRHAVLARDAGHHVTAVDIEVTPLQAVSGITVVAADLEGAPWPFAGQRFDAIIGTNYLHRPLFPSLVAALAPGGVLIWETFGQGNEAYGRPRNPAFLLAPGELLALTAGLQVVAYEHGVEQLPRPAVRQRIVAVKADSPVSLPGA